MNEINLLAKEFLENLKMDYLEKKITQETREKKKKLDLLIEKSTNSSDDDKIVNEKHKFDEAVLKAKAKFQPEANDKYEIANWFIDACNKAKPYVTTHPAKFTNPKISDSSSLLFYGSEIKDGYVKTGNVRSRVRVDVSGNAATNTIIFELYVFLEKRLKNGKTVIKLFEEENPELIKFLNSLNIDFSLMKAKCLEVYYGKEATPSTHEMIRQVFFPVDEKKNSYHLLSVVTASMLMFEAKNRIESFDRWIEGQHVRNLRKNNKFEPDGYDEIYNLTEVGFSHNEFTKMGNVSYLNVRNKGIAYLLPSIPPTLHQRQIRLPTSNFFRNSLRPRQFQESFQTLDRLIKSSINNKPIRDGIHNTLKFLIDQVMQRAFQIRTTGPGWSEAEHYENLPLAQRIWLDDAKLEQRQNHDDWLKEVEAAFARWLLSSYEYLHKDTQVKLSDYELLEVKKLISEALDSDQEFFK
ncbi:MAG: type I-F CRISPR-associated protein Csy1 [Nitrosomonas sp.]|nr:type I-F CRISPR-associated protein Csy1 [Nitrosomonas sp.]